MKLLLIALLACVLVSGLWAQGTSTAQISGTVRDTSGAAIAGAQITVTQTDTGATRTTVSGASGSYLFPDLAIGPYRLGAKKQGFSTFVQTGIVLQVNTNPTIDVPLTVGAISQEISVEANATMVETHATGVGQVIDQERVVDLPLNGRQATQLIVLAGAATITPNTSLNSSKNYPTTIFT